MLPIEDVNKILDTAMGRGAELAELYLEEQKTFSLRLEDGKLEQAIDGEDQGGGVRVFYGDLAAYAYTDDFNPRALKEAAEVASQAAQLTSKPRTIASLVQQRSPLEFKIIRPFDMMDAKSKVDLLHQMDRAARNYNPFVKQVTIELSETRRKVWIFNSDEVWAEDDRSFLEFWIGVTAQRNGSLQQIYDAFGAQSGLELLDVQNPIAFVVDVAQSAVRMLDARPAPAGEMTVVITNGWGGVLFHEACGHAMEADFVMKGASAYHGLVGKQVASPLITAIDDGTIPARRGSYRFDDEGTLSSKTVLIEEGILREYMWDVAEARRAGHGLTGNGRRESFRHMPLPRMSNTYLAGGPHDPEEIIRSVKRGLFVKRLGGGQADTARGDFVFTVTEGYMIEDGRVTSPVRGATIIGNGPQVLRQIDMVGTDFALDEGHGRCGKGQWVRVSVGQPTLRVPKLVIGGTEKVNGE